MNHLADDELVEGYRSSSKQEYIATLFMRYSDAAYRTALRFTGNTADAEDAVQISFIKFLRDFSQFQQGTNVRAWLMRIIVNTCKDKYREEKRRSARHEKFATQKENSKTDEDTAEKEELQTLVKKSVEMLPEKYKTPIFMVMYEGFSYSEVASVLFLPEKTIRTQVARGMSKLRETLGSFGHVLSLDLIALAMKQTTQDAAPATLKSLISGSELYQLSAKRILGESGRLLLTAKTKSSFTLIKVFLAVILGGISIVGGYFALNPGKTATLQQASKAPVLSSKIEETNRTWDFSNVKDRDLKLLTGGWEWSEQLRAMTPPINEVILIPLPINYQEKPFVIEAIVKPLATRERPDLNLLFTGYWVKNEKKLAIYTCMAQPQYLFPDRNQVQRIYFYKNYICVFVKNVCVQVNMLNADITSANPAIATKNVCFQKISSRTLQEPPTELLNAIQKTANEKPQLLEEW